MGGDMAGTTYAGGPARVSSREHDQQLTRWRLLVLATLSAAIVAGLAVLIVHEWSPLLSLDQSIDDALHSFALSTQWVTGTAKALTALGDFWSTWTLAAAAVVILLLLRRLRPALLVLLCAIVAPTLGNWLKGVVDRPRPVWSDPIILAPDNAAYPSGHAIAGIAVWCVVGVALGRCARSDSWAALIAFPFILIGIGIGLSRLVLGVHWPSDVVGGWFLALGVIAVAVAWLIVVPPAAPLKSPPNGQLRT